MRALALALVAVLTWTSAASAASVDLICRGTSSLDGYKDQRVRFHLRVDPAAQTFCLGDCREQLRFTSNSNGIYRYQAGGPGAKVFEVRLQPDMSYRSDYQVECETCALDTRAHEAGNCRNALVRDLVTALTGPTREPWPDPR